MMPGSAFVALTTGLPPPGGRSGANRFAGKPVKWLSFLVFLFNSAFVASIAFANDICEPAPPLAAICVGELEQNFDMVGTLPSFELSYEGHRYAGTIVIEDQAEPGSSARLVYDLAARVLKEKTSESYDFDAVTLVKSKMHEYPKQFAEGVIRDGKTLSREASEVDGVPAYTAIREKRVWTDKRSGIRTAFAINTTMIIISTVREGFDPDAQDRAVHDAVLRAIKVNE